MVRHWRASSPRSWSSSRTKTSGRVSSRSQPSQLANAGRSAIDSAPGMWPAANAAMEPGVDHQPAAGQVPLDLIGREQGQDLPVAAEQLGADPVALSQPQEVGRVAAEAGE
jgi:hypothetical protein